MGRGDKLVRQVIKSYLKEYVQDYNKFQLKLLKREVKISNIQIKPDVVTKLLGQQFLQVTRCTVGNLIIKIPLFTSINTTPLRVTVKDVHIDIFEVLKAQKTQVVKVMEKKKKKGSYSFIDGLIDTIMIEVVNVNIHMKMLSKIFSKVHFRRFFFYCTDKNFRGAKKIIYKKPRTNTITVFKKGVIQDLSVMMNYQQKAESIAKFPPLVLLFCKRKVGYHQYVNVDIIIERVAMNLNERKIRLILLWLLNYIYADKRMNMTEKKLLIEKEKRHESLDGDATVMSQVPLETLDDDDPDAPPTPLPPKPPSSSIFQETKKSGQVGSDENTIQEKRTVLNVFLNELHMNIYNEKYRFEMSGFRMTLVKTMNGSEILISVPILLFYSHAKMLFTSLPMKCSHVYPVFQKVKSFYSYAIYQSSTSFRPGNEVVRLKTTSTENESRLEVRVNPFEVLVFDATFMSFVDRFRKSWPTMDDFSFLQYYRFDVLAKNKEKKAGKKGKKDKKSIQELELVNPNFVLTSNCRIQFSRIIVRRVGPECEQGFKFADFKKESELKSSFVKLSNTIRIKFISLRIMLFNEQNYDIIQNDCFNFQIDVLKTKKKKKKKKKKNDDDDDNEEEEEVQSEEEEDEEEEEEGEKQDINLVSLDFDPDMTVDEKFVGPSENKEKKSKFRLIDVRVRQVDFLCLYKIIRDVLLKKLRFYLQFLYDINKPISKNSQSVSYETNKNGEGEEKKKEDDDDKEEEEEEEEGKSKNTIRIVYFRVRKLLLKMVEEIGQRPVLFDRQSGRRAVSQELMRKRVLKEIFKFYFHTLNFRIMNSTIMEVLIDKFKILDFQNKPIVQFFVRSQSKESESNEKEEKEEDDDDNDDQDDERGEMEKMKRGGKHPLRRHTSAGSLTLSHDSTLENEESSKENRLYVSKHKKTKSFRLPDNIQFENEGVRKSLPQRKAKSFVVKEEDDERDGRDRDRETPLPKAFFRGRRGRRSTPQPLPLTPDGLKVRRPLVKHSPFMTDSMGGESKKKKRKGSSKPSHYFYLRYLKLEKDLFVEFSQLKAHIELDRVLKNFFRWVYSKNNMYQHHIVYVLKGKDKKFGTHKKPEDEILEEQRNEVMTEEEEVVVGVGGEEEEEEDMIATTKKTKDTGKEIEEEEEEKNGKDVVSSVEEKEAVNKMEEEEEKKLKLGIDMNDVIVHWTHKREIGKPQRSMKFEGQKLYIEKNGPEKYLFEVSQFNAFFMEKKKQEEEKKGKGKQQQQERKKNTRKLSESQTGSTFVTSMLKLLEQHQDFFISLDLSENRFQIFEQKLNLDQNIIKFFKSEVKELTYIIRNSDNDMISSPIAPTTTTATKIQPHDDDDDSEKKKLESVVVGEKLIVDTIDPKDFERERRRNELIQQQEKEKKRYLNHLISELLMDKSSILRKFRDMKFQHEKSLREMRNLRRENGMLRRGLENERLQNLRRRQKESRKNRSLQDRKSRQEVTEEFDEERKQQAMILFNGVFYLLMNKTQWRKMYLFQVDNTLYIYFTSKMVKLLTKVVLDHQKSDVFRVKLKINFLGGKVKICVGVFKSKEENLFLYFKKQSDLDTFYQNVKKVFAIMDHKMEKGSSKSQKSIQTGEEEESEEDGFEEEEEFMSEKEEEEEESEGENGGGGGDDGDDDDDDRKVKNREGEDMRSRSKAGKRRLRRRKEINEMDFDSNILLLDENLEKIRDILNSNKSRTDYYEQAVMSSEENTLNDILSTTSLSEEGKEDEEYIMSGLVTTRSKDELD